MSSALARALLLLVASLGAAGCRDTLGTEERSPVVRPFEPSSALLGAQIRIVTAAPVAGQPVTFDASGSGGVNLTRFDWTFGDSSATQTRSSPRGQVHTYAVAGTYTVRLSVHQADGDSAVSTAALVVGTAPARTMTWTPASPAAGQLVTFGLTGVADDPSNPLGVAWQFTGPSVKHGAGFSGVATRFDSAGDWSVAVHAQYPGAAAMRSWAPITIGPAVAPTAGVSCSPRLVELGATVTCTASDIDPISGTLESLAWQSPGVPANGADSAYQTAFAAGGFSEVALTAANSYQRSTTVRDTLGVWPGRGLLGGGRYWACARTSTGPMCWGRRQTGSELGDGDAPSTATPSAVSGGGLYTRLVLTNTGACALRTDGEIDCWGDNSTTYSLGIAPSSQKEALVPTPLRQGGPFLDVTLGQYGGCAVATSGTGHCWGNNGSGQLGRGNTTADSLVVSVSGGLLFSRIVAQQQTMCGLTTASAAYCWGSNTQGNVGDSTTTARSVPAAVRGGRTYTDIAALDYAACALADTGEIYCWGQNLNGQLGDSSTTNRWVPTRVAANGRTFRALADGYHTNTMCAIAAADSTAWCWGASTYGQAGIIMSAVNAPRLVGTTSDRWVVLRRGENAVCGVTTGGRTYCWGRGTAPLWHATTSYLNRTTPVELTQLGDPGVTAEMLPGASTACRRRVDGGVECWGSRTAWGLGDGTGGKYRPSPTSVAGAPAYAAFSRGASDVHTCAVLADGTAHCWGGGSYGQLGENGTVARVAPVLVTGGFAWRSIEAGGSTSCGVTTAAATYCWGFGSGGALGNGTTANKLIPTAVTLPLQSVQVAVGSNHACALASDRKTYCWGAGNSGQVGDSTWTANRTAPVRVAKDIPFTHLAAGNNASCGVAADSTAYCWGASLLLGDGSVSNRHFPNPIPGLKVVQLSMGYSHACALVASGAAYCWGDGNVGQLGRNSTAQSRPPVAVTGGHLFRDIIALGTSSCGVRTDGAVLCWGGNDSGQLGLGDFANRLVPTVVPGLLAP